MNPAIYGACRHAPARSGRKGADGPDRITRNGYDTEGPAAPGPARLWHPASADYATYTYSPNGKRTEVIDANGNRAELSL